MKTIVKKSNLLILLLTAILAFSVSCGPEPDPEPEQDDSCEYQGMTYTDTLCGIRATNSKILN